MTSPRPRPTNTTPYPIQPLTHDPNSEIDLGEEDDWTKAQPGMSDDEGEDGEEIEREASAIFPIKDCYIRKVKVIKKPKFDVTALMEWHTDDGTDVGAAVAPVVAESIVAGTDGRLYRR